MSGKNINLEQAGVGGAKRKNGHKMDCECHICENMNKKAKRGGYKEDIEKQMLQRMGGSKKKNGHKPDCGCPICKNMKNANKKGGDQDEDIEKRIKEWNLKNKEPLGASYIQGQINWAKKQKETEQKEMAAKAKQFLTDLRAFDNRAQLEREIQK